MERPLPFANK